MFGLDKLFNRTRVFVRQRTQFRVNAALRATLYNLWCDVYYGGDDAKRDFALNGGVKVRIYISSHMCSFIFTAPDKAMGTLRIDEENGKHAVFVRHFQDEDDKTSDRVLMERCRIALAEFMLKDAQSRREGLEGFVMGHHHTMTQAVNGGKMKAAGRAKGIAHIVAKNSRIAKSSSPKNQTDLRLVVDNTKKSDLL